MKKKNRTLVCVTILFSAVTLYAAISFSDLCRDIVEKNQNSSVVTGIDGWLFLKDEIRHLAAGRFWGKEAVSASRAKDKGSVDPLPAIIAYNRLLAEKGISLYVMPVPPKALVYPDKLDARASLESAVQAQNLYQEFYGVLAGSGVQTIDMLPVLLQKRLKSKVYCKTDTHYSGEGLAYFAEAAAAVIQEQDWYKAVEKKQYEATSRKVAINGDLGQMSESAVAPEELLLTVITTDSGEILASDPQSPVILLGDSHTLVFSAGGDLHFKGAGLFDHLSARLGFAVDLLGVRGSGVTPARIKLFQRSKKDDSYLDGKKIVIWCFAAREFTGTGGWRNIPVAP
ncbi:MAG: alginate O-acetyltransferase AlgX-related protein [Desulforhopalus sp.]